MISRENRIARIALEAAAETVFQGMDSRGQLITAADGRPYVTPDALPTIADFEALEDLHPLSDLDKATFENVFQTGVCDLMAMAMDRS